MAEHERLQVPFPEHRCCLGRQEEGKETEGGGGLHVHVDADLVDDEGLTGKADAAPDTPTSVMGITDYVYQKNGNKFGTPLPARRGSETVDTSKARGERSSNDSVMVDLVL